MSIECCAKGRRPAHDIADIFRHAGQRFLETFGASHEQIKVMNKIITCRTAALGGHIDFCPDCDYQQNSYNSCRNRHCPKCQTMTKERWLDSRVSERIPATYYHLVFTLPHDLNPVILCNMKLLLDLLFSSVNQTIKLFAADPQWRLQGKPGFIAVLHTWNQTILDHFHLHCLVPSGVLSEDNTQWTPSKKNYLFRTSSLVKVFKGIYINSLKRLYNDGDLKFPGNTAQHGTPPGFNRLIKTIRKKNGPVMPRPPVPAQKKPWNTWTDIPTGWPSQITESNSLRTATWCSHGMITFLVLYGHGNVVKETSLDAGSEQVMLAAESP